MEVLLKRSIRETILKDYSFASILHYFGVRFSDHLDMSLGELCEKHNINIDLLMKHIDSTSVNRETSMVQLKNYPMQMLIDYLIQAHYLFVKVRLPYIASLIKHHEFPGLSKADLEDLRYLFDMFAMDFIQHVREEEDEMFEHITKLIEADQDPKFSALSLHQLINSYSIQDEAIEHAAPNEDMRFIRELNDKYIHTLQKESGTSLELHVLFSEMKSFEKDLSHHARIENEILFPRAVKLEKKMQAKLKLLVAQN